MVSINNLPPSDRKLKEFKYEDEYGRYKTRSFIRVGITLKNRTPLTVSIPYINPDNKDISLIQEDGYSVEVLPIDQDGTERCWRWSQDSRAEREVH